MTPTVDAPFGRRPAAVLLGLVLALGAWLRITGLAFGLPAVYNPDEIAIMSRSLAFATGDLNPHNFLYPTFFFYALFAWLGLFFVAAWLTGAVASLGAFQTQFFVDPTGIYLAGRALGVACGVGTVALVFLLGRRLFGVPAGLAAALFLAVAPTHVRDSHYVKHDVPVTLLIVAACLAMAAVWPSPGRREAGRGDAGDAGRASPRLALAAVLCGMAFSTHYYAVFLALPLGLALWRACGDSPWPVLARRAATVGLVAALVFLALSPFLIVEPVTAWNDIVANRQIVMDRAVAGSRGLFASAPAYLEMLWHEAIGWPVLLAAAGGLALLMTRRPPMVLWLLAFPVPFLLFISNTVAASRYLNPVLPFIAVLAGYAVSEAGGAAREGLGRARARRGVPARPSAGPALLVAGLAIAFALPAFLLSYRLSRFFQQTDTRTLAQRHIERLVPPGSTVLVQPYSVALTQSREGLVEALRARLGDPARASTKFALRLALQPYPAPAYRTIFLGDGGLDADKIYVSHADVDGPDALAHLQRLGVQYVVLKRYNTEDLAVVPLRSVLVAQGTLLEAVWPYRPDAGPEARARVAPFLHNTDTPYDPALERPGPGIEIWKLPL